MSKGAIAGVSIGVIVAVVALLGLAILFFRRRRGQHAYKTTPPAELDLSASSATVPITEKYAHHGDQAQELAAPEREPQELYAQPAELLGGGSETYHELPAESASSTPQAGSPRPSSSGEGPLSQAR